MIEQKQGHHHKRTKQPRVKPSVSQLYRKHGFAWEAVTGECDSVGEWRGQGGGGLHFPHENQLL